MHSAIEQSASNIILQVERKADADIDYKKSIFSKVKTFLTRR